MKLIQALRTKAERARELRGEQPSPQEVRHEVRAAYLEELSPAERAALLSWLGFTVTFATARGVTHSIKKGKGPFHDVSKGGVHLHHYLWGIAMLTGVGAVAVHGDDERRRHPTVALSYGVGLGLIIDEFALLVDLEDVYWSTKGRLSVEVGTGVIGAGGTLLAALPILRRLNRSLGPGRALPHRPEPGKNQDTPPHPQSHPLHPDEDTHADAASGPQPEPPAGP
jgi:hypothetical protein